MQLNKYIMIIIMI